MAILSFILALVALAGVVVLLAIVIEIARNLSRHVKSLKKVFDSFEKLVDGKIEMVESKIDDHLKKQKEWEEAIRKWVQEQLTTQHLQNEQAVQKVADAIASISKSRETMAASFLDFVSLLRAAMRAEKLLLEKATDSTGTDKDSDRPKEVLPPSTE